MTTIGWIILGVIYLGVVITVLSIDGWKWLDVEDVFIAFGKGLIVTIIVLVTCFILALISDNEEIEVKEPIAIHALIDTQTLDGEYGKALFVGYGNISNELKYVYRQDYKDGKKISYTNIDNSYIIESDTEAPCVIETITYKHCNWLGKIFFKNTVTSQQSEYKFIIPRGSLIEEYKSDMK